MVTKAESRALGMKGRGTNPFRIAALLMLAFAAIVLWAAPAGAHNSLVESEPAEGATVATLPAVVVLRFANPVPLDTASAEVIDESGNRAAIEGLRHGPAGESEVVAPLPGLAGRDITVRWRLVGPDGHLLTGRVQFAVAPPASSPPVTDDVGVGPVAKAEIGRAHV